MWLGGHVLGGGYGRQVRKFGLLCDSLFSIQMVNFKGDVLEANDLKNSDLLWASKGGGGSQFGILTSMQIQAYPVKETLTKFQFVWKGCDLVSVMEWWQIATPYAPKRQY